MSTSDYDEIEGYENRILFWLRLDKWDLHQAALLFIDINPDTVGSDFYSLITLREVKYNDFDNSIEMLELRSKYDDLRRILSFSVNTPQGWIDLALSKKIAIPWLEFAIREGFYKTEKTTIDKINSKNNAHNCAYLVNFKCASTVSDVLSMFVGDFLGCLILLYVLSISLKLVRRLNCKQG